MKQIKHLSLRLYESDIEKIDKVKEILAKETGEKPTITGAIRYALHYTIKD